jgi:hypothetical protein
MCVINGGDQWRNAGCNIPCQWLKKSGAMITRHSFLITPGPFKILELLLPNVHVSGPRLPVKVLGVPCPVPMKFLSKSAPFSWCVLLLRTLLPCTYENCRCAITKILPMPEKFSGGPCIRFPAALKGTSA